ncbi:MAG: DUF1176 domain-containing protein [Sphingomonas sp.]
MLALLFLLAAADAAPPKPGSIQTFGDWAVACDNVRRCEMTSLIPEDEAQNGGDSDAFSIVREPGPNAGFEIDGVGSGEGETSVRIDGKIIAGSAAHKGVMTLTGADAAKIVAAMVNGRKLTLTDIGGAHAANVSLDGSSAALRFMDAQQGRAGGVTAAVAKGPKPASAVPAVAPLPRIRSIASSGSAAKVTPALIKAMRTISQCDAEDSGSSEPITGDAIGGGATLVLLPCGAGAYNFSSVPFIVTGGKPNIARFDSAPGFGGEGFPTLVNAEWDAKTGQLGSYAKGRGLGDCGSSEAYVWDGARFRLIEATQMGECRGSVNWLTVWRAVPVR